MKRRYLHPKLRLGAVAAALLCLMLAADTWPGPGPAQAQVGASYVDLYVDLVVTEEYPAGPSGEGSRVRFVVHNHGTAEARGVTVSFLLDKLQAWYSNFSDNVNSRPFSVTDVRKAGGQESFTWVAGTIPEGGSTQFSFGTTRNTTFTSSTYVIGSIRAEASSLTFEPPELKHNNVRTLYAFSRRSTGLSLDMINGRLGLYLSVDNFLPTSGSPDVDFDLTARSHSPNPVGNNASQAIADIAISVELSEGLQFKSGWTPPTGFTTSGSRSAIWSPDDVGNSDTGIANLLREIDIETSLTSDSLDDIPLEERCITARVTDSKPPPEPGYALSSLTQCLGDIDLICRCCSRKGNWTCSPSTPVPESPR